MASAPVRVRIAPSPTGPLHVGTARAALFNELFARGQGGTFIVRLEDTDRARSRPEYEANILAGLTWLGLIWDEGPDRGGPYGPYRQSERSAHYVAAIESLLASGAAYRDPAGGSAIYLTVNPQAVVFTDLIRGQVEVEPRTWGGDFVIARAPDDPLYHLAVVVDDATMAISHVIRGVDHLTNTARHILLQQALHYPTPQYAHLPLILDPQRRKLSKRTGSTSLESFRQAGFLPEAMLNYLALLGWNPDMDREYFTHDELIARFSLMGVQRGGAIFAREKLEAFNRHYLRQLTPSELLQRSLPFLTAAGYTTDSPAYWAGALKTEQSRIATLAALPEAIVFFRRDWDAPYPTERLWGQASTRAATAKVLTSAITFTEQLKENSFTELKIREAYLNWMTAQGLGRGEVLWPLRVALTGQEQSPSFFEVAAVLGKAEVVRRLRLAAQRLL